MNKAQLIKDIVEKTGESPIVSQTILDAFIEIIGERLQTDERLALKSLGIFSLQDVAATRIRNIQTGETMEIKPRKRIRFKPSAEFTATVFGKK